MALLDAFGIRRIRTNTERDRERATARLVEQEQRVQALDRAVEVIGRTLAEDRPPSMSGDAASTSDADGAR